MRHLIGKTPRKEVSFCNEKLTIKKMGVDQVFEIQERSKAIKNAPEEEQEQMNIDLIQFIVNAAVVRPVDQAELSKEEFRTFPVDELSTLSNSILQFSGLATAGNVSK